jgi:hypothetical protein
LSGEQLGRFIALASARLPGERGKESEREREGDRERETEGDRERKREGGRDVTGAQR